MGDVENGMGGKRQREDGERVPRIAHQRRRRDDEKADGEGDVEADALLRFVADRKSDVDAGGHRQQQGGELAEAKLRHETVRRRGRDERCADGVPRESDRQPAPRHGDRAQAFSHDRKYSWSSPAVTCHARATSMKLSGSMP